MPRPKTVSDTAILDAANAVLAERGMADFTLADIARRVGLSRATVIQRFGDRDAILLRMAEREAEMTRDYLASIAVEPGVDGLWRFLKEIVSSMGAGEDFSVRVAIAALEIRDPRLKALADARYGMVRQAMEDRVPDLPEKATLALHLHAVIAGSTMQWVVKDHPDLAGYVMEAVREAMSSRFPDADFG